MAETTDWQARVIRFAETHDFQHGRAVHALDLVSELGEVAKEILLATDYGRRARTYRPAATAELGDALYSLCLLATAMDVNLNDSLTETLAKYERRWQTHGSVGSGQNETP